MGYWEGMRYYQTRDTFVEIDDTFADKYVHSVIAILLGTVPFFPFEC